MKRYALKDKTKFSFKCIAETLTEHKKKVAMDHSNWAGMQGRGSDTSIEKYLSHWEQVTITIDQQ